MTGGKSTQKSLNWRRDKGTTTAASQLDGYIRGFPPSWSPCGFAPSPLSAPRTGQCTTKPSFLGVPQSEARLFKHWKDSISMPMSASLIYSQKPTVDPKSNHKRQQLPGIQTNKPSYVGENTLKFQRHSFICSVRHSRPLSSRRLPWNRKYISC